MTAPAIEVEGLSVYFKGLHALEDVSFSIPRGQRRAIIGPNGAGKTTLFNALDGRIRPTHGSVRLFGDDTTRLATHVRARRGLARTYQITNLFGDLTVKENAQLSVAGVRARTRRNFWRPLERIDAVVDRAEQLLRQWDLWDVRDRVVHELAYGQQRVLEIVMALGGDPQVLLLDEPTAGLSKGEADLLTEVAAALPVDLTLLVIEHDMDVAFKLGRAVTVLSQGQILAEGTPEEIRSDSRVIETYLGERDDTP